MARKGTKPISEICKIFGVTRQTLTKAVTTAEEAAKAALEPKKPGRKPKSEESLKITELSKSQSLLTKEVEHWKTRYEVAQAYIDIVHEEDAKQANTERNRKKRERKKQKKKKPRNRKDTSKSSGTASETGGGASLAVIDGGADTGNTDAESETMEK
ncbi:MAG: hypothetical protein GY847_17640 [Proteobacteria bacterium]|nr:hypothetical protein [Pseudomonadota bacterium]